MLEKHDPQEMKIHFEIDIEASIEKVWALVSSLDGMNQWLSRNLRFDFFEGGEFHMVVNQKEEGEFLFFGEVVSIIPLKELAFTWIEQEKGKDAWPISTLVKFTLEDLQDRTRVTLTHSGFDKLANGLATSEYEGHIVGWERAETLLSLKKAVEG